MVSHEPPRVRQVCLSLARPNTLETAQVPAGCQMCSAFLNTRQFRIQKAKLTVRYYYQRFQMQGLYTKPFEYRRTASQYSRLFWVIPVCEKPTRLLSVSVAMTSQTKCVPHNNDVIMSTIASQITSIAIVYSTVYSAQIKENIKAPRHWPLCGEFTGTGEFPAQRASNAENVSIWWRYHERATNNAHSYNGPPLHIKYALWLSSRIPSII